MTLTTAALQKQASHINIYDHFAHEDEYSQLDTEKIADRLAQAIRCKTVYAGEKNTDFSQFDRLQKLMETEFPHVLAASSQGLERIGYSVLITIPGSDPELSGVMLIAHQDVVPVVAGTKDRWIHGAFDGVVDDEFIWGRGALDIKDMLMGELEAVEFLLAQGFSPRRSIYLAFGEDEEVDSRGATRIAACMEERGICAECLLDEGTTTFFDGSVYGAPGTILSDICISQKGFLNVRLTVRGCGGHSSNPFGGTSLEHMCTALSRLAEHPFPPQLNAIVCETFQILAPHITEEPFATLVKDLPASGEKLAEAASAVRELYPFVNTTMAVNMLEGGSSTANVMPGDVQATINFRMLPGTTAEDVLNHVHKALGELDVEVEALHTTPAGRMDKTDKAGYQELKEVLEHYYPKVEFVPSFVCGGTDSIRYESICDSILRISPFRPTPEDEATGVHGINERIAKRVYMQGIRVLIDFIKRMAG